MIIIIIMSRAFPLRLIYFFTLLYLIFFLILSSDCDFFFHYVHIFFCLRCSGRRWCCALHWHRLWTRRISEREEVEFFYYPKSNEHFHRNVEWTRKIFLIFIYIWKAENFSFSFLTTCFACACDFLCGVKNQHSTAIDVGGWTKEESLFFLKLNFSLYLKIECSVSHIRNSVKCQIQLHNCSASHLYCFKRVKSSLPLFFWV